MNKLKRISRVMYAHTELPELYLQDRARELIALEKIPHSEPRKSQIASELGYIIFELWARNEYAD